jgi:hypothetical protein
MGPYFSTILPVFMDDLLFFTLNLSWRSFFFICFLILELTFHLLVPRFANQESEVIAFTPNTQMIFGELHGQLSWHVLFGLSSSCHFFLYLANELFGYPSMKIVYLSSWDQVSSYT